MMHHDNAGVYAAMNFAVFTIMRPSEYYFPRLKNLSMKRIGGVTASPRTLSNLDQGVAAVFARRHS